MASVTVGKSMSERFAMISAEPAMGETFATTLISSLPPCSFRPPRSAPRAN